MFVYVFLMEYNIWYVSLLQALNVISVLMSLTQDEGKQKMQFDDAVKKHWIMGFVYFMQIKIHYADSGRNVQRLVHVVKFYSHYLYSCLPTSFLTSWLLLHQKLVTGNKMTLNKITDFHVW